MLTVPDLIVRAFALPPLADPPQPLPEGVRCAITAQPVAHGYPVQAIVTDATNEFLDTFHGQPQGYISESAARAFKDSKGKAYLLFEDGTTFRPLISAESAAEQGRPSWSDLVRQVWPERQGQRCLMLLTTDMKKRLWPRARIGVLGSHTPLYYHDSATCISRVLWVDWQKLLSTLDQLESLYALGFSKTTLRESLYRDHARCKEQGFAAVAGWEAALTPLRPTPEFAVAALIAQKLPEPKEQSNG